jgi:hypothetical protein
MYLNNKYKRIYDRLIKRGLKRDFIEIFESHHILPRSCGGSDDSNNLVKLTPREHLIAHMLLPKFTIGEAKNKMICAYAIMSGRKDYGVSFNSRSYQRFKEEYSKINSESVKGSKNPMYGIRKIGENNPFYGKKHTEETKKRISDSLLGQSYNKGIKKSDNHKKNLSKAKKEHWNNLSKEEKKEMGDLISQGWANKALMKCPHCGLEGKANMKRYHFDNCKKLI